MLRKQKAASNVQARLLCAEVYRDANPVCRCFRRPAEYTAGWGYVQTSGFLTSLSRLTVPISRRGNVCLRGLVFVFGPDEWHLRDGRVRMSEFGQVPTFATLRIASNGY